MTGVVEELAEALKELLRFRLVERNEISSPLGSAVKAARLAISRFNAERGDGVWVPREPTKDHILTMAFAAFKSTFIGDADAAWCSMSNDRRNMRILRLAEARAAFAALIAAINPEGNDNETK